MTEPAPAKINLCLFVGPPREDGRHELVSVMQPLAWGDEVRAEPADADEVVCPGVEGANLVTRAIAELRAEAAGVPGLRLTVEKRIPVAAGLGGGSADAGAALRIAAASAGIEDDALLLRVAERLGADVPAQVRPRTVLATGAGERLEPLAPPRAFGVLVLPSQARLATADVYREADRLGLPRAAADLAERLADVRAGAGAGAFGLPQGLLVNDLEPAALSLCPAIEEALDTARVAGADRVLVAGSGPTVLGLFGDPEGAVRAAERLAARKPAPVATRPFEAPG